MKLFLVGSMVSAFVMLTGGCGGSGADGVQTPETVIAATQPPAGWPRQLNSIVRVEKRQGHPCCIDPIVLDGSNAAEASAIGEGLRALADAGPLVSDPAPMMQPLVVISFDSAAGAELRIAPAMNCRAEASGISCEPAPGYFWLIEPGGSAGEFSRFYSLALEAWYGALEKTGHPEPWQSGP